MDDRREVLLAVELVRLGVDLVVVGGTARLLRDGHGDPRDLDVVVEDAGADRVAAALTSLGAPTTGTVLRRCRDVRVDTAWGPLDVFLASRPAAGPVRVRGTDLAVAVGPAA